MFMFALAFTIPNAISMTFLILSHVLLMTMTYGVEFRLRAAWIFELVTLALLIFIIIYKLPSAG